MKVRLPLTPRTVDGIACPYPRVVLQVRDRYGLLAPLPFRIDTGADCSAIPLALARKEKIPHQETQSSIAAGLVGAAAKFRDRIQVVIAGKEHDWPCDFIEVPPPAPGRVPDPLLQVPVLGRAGFLDEYAFSLDSDYLVITRIGPIRRFLRERLRCLWYLFGMVHRADRPL